MQVFERFNFDIAIILVLSFSFITGLYYSSLKQSEKLLSLLIPFAVLYFGFNKLFQVYNEVTKGGLFKTNQNALLINGTIVYILSFIILSLIIKVLYSIFKPSAAKRVLNETRLLSRILGSFLGLLNGYVILVILIYLISPFVRINNNSLLTKLVNQANNEVIVVTKLNEIQNINTNDYDRYTDALEVYTGRAKLDALNSISKEFKKIEVTENYIKEEMLLIIGGDSLNLINTYLEDDNYINTLLKIHESIPVYQHLLTLEVTNEHYSKFNEVVNSIKNNPYLYIYNNYLTNSWNLNSLEESILLNEQEILKNIKNNAIRLELINNLEDIKTYNKYRDLFNIYSELDFVQRVDEVEMKLLKHEDILDLATMIETLEDDDLVRDLKEIFTKYKEHQDNILKLNQNMSIVNKVIIARDFYYFKEKRIKSHSIIDLYITNSLTSTKLAGYEIYHEFFFYNYLAFDLGISEVISEDYYNEIKTRLNNLSEDVLTESEKISYFSTLINNHGSCLNDLVRRGQLNIDILGDNS